VRPQEREARGRRRSVWPSLGLAFGVLALLYLGGWGITGARYSRELARLKARGEPVVPRDLVPEVRPGEHNAADIYEAAATLAPTQAIADLYPMWDTQVLTLAQKYSLAQAMVASNRPYFELLDEASRTDRCAFEAAWDDWDATFDQLRGLVMAVRALTIRSELRAHGGDLDGALDSCTMALRVANHTAQAPRPVAYRTASKMDGEVQDDVLRMLAEGDPSPTACRRLFDQLGRQDYRASWVRALKAERAAKVVAIGWLEHGGLFQAYAPRRPARIARSAYPIVAKPTWNADKTRCLELMAAYLEAARQPWPEAIETAWRLDEQTKAVPTNPGDAWYESSGPYLFDRFGPRFWRAGRGAATAGALQVALALKAHHRERGGYPVTLAELEQSGWKLPRDPFCQRPYHYRRETSGFTVWSVGPDGRDDSGRAPSGHPIGRPKPGYDFVVRCAR
jgi:hypothetical protein